ncbi:MAG: hypothetical protein IH951_11725 [Bacteroidetes bacterium]|nr:hypothetical protein [Bacteroidota bacterium]
MKKGQIKNWKKHVRYDVYSGIMDQIGSLDITAYFSNWIESTVSESDPDKDGAYVIFAIKKQVLGGVNRIGYWGGGWGWHPADHE